MNALHLLVAATAMAAMVVGMGNSTQAFTTTSSDGSLSGPAVGRGGRKNAGQVRCQ